MSKSLISSKHTCHFSCKYVKTFSLVLSTIFLSSVIMIYINLPKFLIDDVILERDLILRWRDLFFWTQRSIFHKETSTSSTCKMKKNVNCPIVIMHWILKYHWNLKVSSRWRHQGQRSPPRLNLRFQDHSQIANFEDPYLSQIAIFFDAVFFVRFVWLSTFDLAPKNGVNLGVQFPFNL